MAMEKAAIVALGSGSMPPYGRLPWLIGEVGLGGGDAARVTTTGVVFAANQQNQRDNPLKAQPLLRVTGLHSSQTW